MSKKRQSPVSSLAFDYPGGYVIPPHTHDWHQLVYASRGVMTIDTPDGAWVVPPHRGVWVPGGVVHAIQISGEVAMRTLYIDPRRARALPTACRVLEIAPLLREIILHAVERGGLDRRVPSEARLARVMLDLVRAALREGPSAALTLPEPRDPRAARLAALLRADPGTQRPLAALLRGVGASARTIERRFKIETGMTFGRWRQQLRLVHALRLLAAGTPVTAVALDVGYDSPSAFVSAFRRTFGATPGRYFRA
jgi:AraC-like DNA-binding protein